MNAGFTAVKCEIDVYPTRSALTQIAALFQVGDCFPHHAMAEMSLPHA